MKSLTREPDGNVVLRSGAFALRFFPRFGGCPLEWWYEPHPLLTNRWPGSGASVAWNTGQDPTQASPNGIMPWPISPFGAPASYWGFEAAFDPALCVYTVQGFAPDFWLSHEAIDDAPAPPVAGGPSGWFTKYNPGAYAVMVNSPANPVVFRGTKAQPQGLFYVGHELSESTLPLPQRIRRYRGGRVAFQIELSLKGAEDTATAGVFIRSAAAEVGALNLAQALGAPGYLFRVDRGGRWRITERGTTLASGRLSKPQRAQLTSTAGVLIEGRSFNWGPPIFAIMVAGVQICVISQPAPVLGEGLALYANCSKGPAVFNNRRVADVGQWFVAKYQALDGGQIESDLFVESAPPSIGPRIFYRANLPGVFLNKETFPTAQRFTAGITQQGVTEALEPTKIVPLSAYKSLFAGRADGEVGICATPQIVEVDGQPSQGHALLQRVSFNDEFVLMLNPLPVGGKQAEHMRIKTLWQPHL